MRRPLSLRSIARRYLTLHAFRMTIHAIMKFD